MSHLPASNLLYTRFGHWFHLVNPSPWPLMMAIVLMSAMMHVIQIVFMLKVMDIFLLLVMMNMGFWWRDVIRESTYELAHSPIVRSGLLWGMALFIISEALLFFGFFWAFFHSSLTPSSAIGNVWPPLFIPLIDAAKLPLVNTVTLIMSGFTLTITHKLLKKMTDFYTCEKLIIAQRFNSWLFNTIGLGVFFLGCQAFEYYFAKFTYTDSIYGTTFYSLTGLHGFHVMVGTVFLLICLIRGLHLTIYTSKNVGFTSANWYWHFVDVVWIALFLIIYLWGSYRSF